MRVLFISEIQWLSQISRKHLIIRRLPEDWEIRFVAPINARAGENSFRTRTARDQQNVRYASLPLPKPDSGLAPVRALTSPLLAVGGRAVLALAMRFRPDVAVTSFLWAAPLVPALKRLGAKVVYDANDLHYEFYPARRDEARRMFWRLVDAADEVVASSRYLREVCGRGTVIGNGVDLATFTGRTATPLPGALAKSRLLRDEGLVAYAGSVDERIDFAILERLLVELEQSGRRIGLVCLGRIFDPVRAQVEALERRHPERVLFTGRVPYSELPSYLSHCAVGIAPFVLGERTRAINPNKLYMYAAMEQNIVSTPFSDEISDERDLVFIATTPDEFARAVVRALTDDARRGTMRGRIALPNSWDKKASEFATLLEGLRHQSPRPAT